MNIQRSSIAQKHQTRMQVENYGHTLGYVLQELKREHNQNSKITLNKPKSTFRRTSAESFPETVTNSYAVTPIKKYKLLSPLPIKNQIAAHNSVQSKVTNEQNKTMRSSLNFASGS